MSYTLNEILWEFTLKCNKNCEYCGSKNLLNNEKSTNYTEEQIAKYILKANPKSLTITGGEPACEIEKLRKCVDILHKSNIEIKILTNGKLFNEIKSVTDNLYCYTKCFGLSINTFTDIYIARDNHYDKYSDKTTVITNFGTHNIGNFDNIAKYALQFPCWQVQLTMGNEFQLDKKDIIELNNKLDNINNTKLCKIVKADNFNCNKCMAGIQGFSITHDGYIIPCLSYRAWKSNLNIQGEVKDIVNIWKNGFTFNRNREIIPCCKDITGINKIFNEKDSLSALKELLENKKENKSKDDIVFVYGVTLPKENYPPYTVVYGVSTIPEITSLDSNNISIDNSENTDKNDK